MITVRPPGGAFFPEQAYVAECLLADFCGLDVQILPGGAGRWELDCQGNILTLPDCFFPERRPEVWGTAAHKPGGLVWIDNPVASSPFRSLPAPFFLPGAVTPEQVDIFGLAFFLLTRYEEWTAPELDKEGRINEKKFWMHRGKVHRIPLVDEWLDVLLWLLREKAGYNPGLPARAYRLHLSHDIDMPFVWAAHSRLRGLLRIGKRTWETRSPVFLSRAVYGYFVPEKDPFFSFAWFMHEEETRGLRSASYFLAGGGHKHDIPYSLAHPALGALYRRLRERGHEIGLHGSFLAAGTPGLLADEARRLREACGAPVRGGRQHWLTFDASRTWRYWHEAGLAYDSSLGYAEDAGFRAGTCREYPVYDLVGRKPLPLRERPLIIMEGALLEKPYLHLPPAEAYDLVLELNAHARRHRGDFTVLWHNNTLYTAEQRALFLALLDSCG